MAIAELDTMISAPVTTEPFWSVTCPSMDEVDCPNAVIPSERRKSVKVMIDPDPVFEAYFTACIGLGQTCGAIFRLRQCTLPFVAAQPFLSLGKTSISKEDLHIWSCTVAKKSEQRFYGDLFLSPFALIGLDQSRRVLTNAIFLTPPQSRSSLQTEPVRHCS